MATNKLFAAILVLLLVGGIEACSRKGEENTDLKVQSFGRTPDGREASLYTLKNRSGMEVSITNYGGIVVSLRVPDKAGALDDVVLGYDSLAQYIKANPYFGALIGRYGNRIKEGKFSLDGIPFTLPRNNGNNHLHGGNKGFDKVVWNAEVVRTKIEPSIVLTYLSKDGEEGYPGNLKVKAVYTLTDSNELDIQLSATTDKPTVVNLTAHSYFNLAGARATTTILDHELMIDAERFTPIDTGLIPTGELRSVAGTPMDFRTPTPIGARIASDDEQLHRAGGYDHNWVLNRAEAGMRIIARVTEPTTGRTLEVLSTEPGVQFYSGNFLDGTLTGKGGRQYVHRFGLCLEPQHFPDSPNRPEFPSTTLRPGQEYAIHIAYRFGVK